MPLLTHKRILITRTRKQASELATQLEALGAVPIAIPTIEIVPPETYASLDAALTRLESFDWLLFTSINAVEVFHQRVTASQSKPTDKLPRIAVIGPATARAVQGIGFAVDLVPPKYIAESLAEALTPHASGAKILLVRASEARDYLPETLTTAGAHVTIAEAYRNQIPLDSISALQQLFSDPRNYPDAITFTSASTVRNLVALLEAANLILPGNIVLISIGPITSQALRDQGFEPAAEASEPSIPALIEALATVFE